MQDAVNSKLHWELEVRGILSFEKERILNTLQNTLELRYYSANGSRA